MAHCDADDLNGDLFVVGSEGEVEERRASRVIVLPQGVPAVGTDAHPEPAAVTTAHLDAVFRANYRVLRGNGDQCGLDAALAANVAYLRLLAYRKGLLRADAALAEHHLRYNEVERVADYAAGADGGRFFNADNAACNAAYDAVPRAALRAKFTNLVCIVAFFFRQRGHHWLENFDARYQAVWRKCLYAEDTPGIPWQHVAHTALHAIWPHVLDAYWLDAVARNRCAGTLKKRVNCAPAGSAGPIAIQQNLADLVKTFPKIRELHADDIDWLNQETARITGDQNRWAGSVNAVFYLQGDNSVNYRVPEQRLASLASKMINTLRVVAANNALVQSPSVTRIADGAPITGGVFGLLIAAQIAYVRERGTQLMADMGGAPLLAAAAPAPAAPAGAVAVQA